MASIPIATRFNTEQAAPGTPMSWVETGSSDYNPDQAVSNVSSTRNFPMEWKSARYTFSVSKAAHKCLWPRWDEFKNSVLAENEEADASASPLQTLEIMALFLEYLREKLERTGCHDNTAHQRYFGEILDVVDRDFVVYSDIHNVASTLDVSLERQKVMLRAYYRAIQYTARDLRVNEPLLWRLPKPNDLKIYSIFTGQGNANAECLGDLRDLWKTYKPLLEDLISSTGSFLYELSQTSDTTDFYNNEGLDIRKWLDEEISLEPAYIASAPISFTILGLVNLANFCIMCKAAHMTPGDAINATQAVTGHSQGIVVAACLAKARTWEDFYEAARLSLEILFWIGYESHQDAPGSTLSGHQIHDSLENGENTPSHMLSVRGQTRQKVEDIVRIANKGLAKDEQVCLALVNSRDNVVLAGPPKSLRGLALHLRTSKASKGEDQSRIPYNKRKLETFSQFLPISAPFHSKYLLNATERTLSRLDSCIIRGTELATAVISTSTGSDLREAGDSNVIPDLVRMVTCELVDWPAASMLPGATHIIEFGPGQFSNLMAQMKEGTGARVIAAGSLRPFDSSVGSKAELFDAHTSLSKTGQYWETEFGPRVTKTASGQTLVETKFSKFLKLPPIIVAGMTPTTVPWDFVAAICNAGFHVELAGGGYFNAEAFKQAILNVTSNIPAGRGLAVNLIYVNPRAIAWQIPLIRQLIREGVPVDGITIGAGVPSVDIAHDYITTIGLKYIGFKPGSVESIRQVINIANAHPDFPIIMQWTGGRGGGHHSFEDFHNPMLQMYGRVRRCPNIILVAGSGFGDAEDSYPYLTGDWAEEFGYPKMPFDAILLGSRMMVAKEAHTSFQAKQAIVEAKGVPDADWAGSYDRETGGVITVLSEMGQPIHKIATRGVLFWSEMDKMIFSLNGPKRLAALEAHREYIIRKLNADYAKVWFPTNASGEIIELEDMTYHEVVLRMIELMYVAHQSRWIDKSYKAIILDFVLRIHERFASKRDVQDYDLELPFKFANDLAKNIPQCQEQLLSPEDVKYFLSICKQPGRKPVNFVPRLDESFEVWFKKDSLWQAEDVEAVIGQDVGRTCILQGPMAAHYSKEVDESARDILDGMHQAYISRLRQRSLSLGDRELREEFRSKPTARPSASNIDFEIYGGKMRFKLDQKGNLPDPQTWFTFIATQVSGWLREIFDVCFVLQGRTKAANPIRKIFSPKHGVALEIDSFEHVEESRVSLLALTPKSDSYRQIANITCKNNHTLHVDLFEFRTRGQGFAKLSLLFNYDPTNEVFPVSEVVDDRNDRLRDFYSQLWFGKHLSQIPKTTLRSSFLGAPVTLTKELISSFTHAIGGKKPNQNKSEEIPADVSMDIAIIASWEVLMKPLLCREVNGDLLRLVHKSNSFKYVTGAKSLKIGDVLRSNSSIQGVYIEDSGKVVDVLAVINCGGKPIIEVNSTFLFQGTHQDFQDTFKVVKEQPVSLTVRSTKLQALLRGREWFLLDDDSTDLNGEQLRFEPETRYTYAGKNLISSLEVSGRILSTSTHGESKQIGSIDYKAGRCAGNPVTDFLSRWGSPLEGVIKLKNPNNVNEGEASSFKAPRSNELYARVSGDYNPIHVSEMFAAYANLPGTITHGMYTSAAVRSITEQWMARGETQCFKRWFASFTGMVLPGDKIQVKMSHTGMVQGRKLIEVTATNERSGDTVLKAEAEIEDPKTAYVFTGQGSQAKGMGMELYASSAVVRDIWDKADKHMIETYGKSRHNLISYFMLTPYPIGWSLLEVIRNNPKSLTVHFGGQRGRRIRNNYLSMQIERTDPNGRTYTEPILRDLKPNTSCYTFMHPAGLLFLTQFAQPTLTLLEKATFADLQSKGLAQQGAKFAGHSLGEYGALGSMTDFMPIERLVSVAFYRGLTMSVSMERDEHGRTDYSMMAVNPSRVMKGQKLSPRRRKWKKTLLTMQ